MNGFHDSVLRGLELIAGADATLLSIVGRSLAVSGLACLVGGALGLFLGAWLGVTRFPGRGAVLLRFGVLADQAALAAGSNEPSPRERLFDMVMSRFDALQQHRAGVLQLLRALRFDPATSLLLYSATLRSMKWLLDGAGIPSNGIVGGLRGGSLRPMPARS